MRIKMLTSAVADDIVNLQHSAVYELEDSLCQRLIDANFATLMVVDLEDSQPTPQEPQLQKTKKKRTKKTPKEEV